MHRPTWRRMALLAAVLLLSLLAAIQYRTPRSPLLGQLREYFAANRQRLDLSDGGAHFDAGLIDTQGKRIFFLGESHGVAVNEELDFVLLRYLHRTAHVRVYLSEIPYSQACLLNRYLETGAESVLAFLLAECQGTSIWTREHRDFLRRVRAWNASLDRRDRIRIEGVDIEHQPHIAIRFLSDSVAGLKVPPSIAGVLSRLPALRNASGADGSRFAEELVVSMQQSRSDYSTLLGDLLFDFESVANNLRNSGDFYGGRDRTQTAAFREQLMYETFLRIYPRLAGQNCYGRWGADHIIQQSFRNHEPFAAMLNRPHSPVAGRIVSIQPIYEHSYGTIFDGRAYRDYRASAPAAFLEPFAPLAQGPVTIFRTVGATALLARQFPTYPLGEGAQYVVFFRGAAAAHPLGNR